MRSQTGVPSEIDADCQIIPEFGSQPNNWLGPVAKAISRFSFIVCAHVLTESIVWQYFTVCEYHSVHSGIASRCARRPIAPLIISLLCGVRRALRCNQSDCKWFRLTGFRQSTRNDVKTKRPTSHKLSTVFARNGGNPL